MRRSDLKLLPIIVWHSCWDLPEGNSRQVSWPTLSTDRGVPLDDLGDLLPQRQALGSGAGARGNTHQKLQVNTVFHPINDT